MSDNVTTDEVVESLVRLTYGESDARTQQLFRQNLQVLVELAKCEQRQEWSADIPEYGSARAHTVH